MTRPADEQSGRPTAAPAAWLRELTVVLFDLDGTLHDDPRALDRYVTALQVSIPDGAGLGLREEVASVIAGHHPAARPGRFVEPVRGLVLDAPEWVVESATDWQGQPVTVPDGLAGRVQHDGPLRYLGDRWQIITAVAARRGADKSVLAAAFRLTRRFVNDPDNDLLRLDCVDGLLERLAVGRRLLLATNTPEELARPLVDRLDLRHPFALVRFDARKPAGCAELIGEAHRRWGATPPRRTGRRRQPVERRTPPRRARLPNCPYRPAGHRPRRPLVHSTIRRPRRVRGCRRGARRCPLTTNQV